MKTTVYLLRHGQSQGNAVHCFLGQSDWGLTELGHQQARCAAQAARNLPLDKIYSSDLSRAWQTTEPVAALHNLPIHPEPGMREINAGLWETHHFEELIQTYPEEYTRWRTDIAHAHPNGGESTAELYERVYEALNRIEAQSRGLTVLIGTHATPIRMLMARINHGCLEAANDIRWVPNASLTKLVCENGKWRIEYAGDESHLGDLHSNLPATV